MKTFLIFIAYFAAAFAQDIVFNNDLPIKSDAPISRIINGKLAYPGQFPWQVGIFHTTSAGNKFCGGSLISNEWILTAAHCVYGAKNFQVILGATRAYDPEPGKIQVPAAKALYHPHYNPRTLKNDVGLIKLAHPVQFTQNIRPIRLARSRDHVNARVNVTVSGWGKTRDSEPGITNYLFHTDLTTITNDDCKRYYIPELVSRGVLCASGLNLKSACQGDSGGPLIAKDYDGYPVHVGVVSFVSSRGCEVSYPSGFSRTSSYIGFINANTGLNFP